MANRNNLNPAQKLAVESTHNKILCLAGAGTGKTATLTGRIAYLNQEQRVSCHQMLALTFTRLAGREMKERVIRLIGKAQGSKLFANTFHAFCVKVLKEYGFNLGYGKDFTIYDQDDTVGIITTIIKDFMYKSVSVDKVVNALNADPASQTFDSDITAIVKEYKYRLRQNNAFDFNGLITNTLELFKKYPDVCNEYRKLYRYVFVDEFQDTSDDQWELITLLNPENLFVVGDDFQCWDGSSMVRTTAGHKPIDTLNVGEEVLTAARGKITYSPVTAKSEPIWRNIITITTSTGKSVRVTPDHRCFATLPSFSKFHYVYLMYRKDKGFRIGVTSGGKTGELNNRTASERPSRVWLIKQCALIEDAHYFEDFYSLKYQIPKCAFFSNSRNIAMGQERIDWIFRDFGNLGGKKLLSDLGYKFDYPHYIPQGTERHNECKKNINLVMNSKNGVMVSFENGDSRIRKCFRTYKEAWKFANDLKIAVDADIIFEKFANKDRVTIYTIPASQVLLGMMIPTEDGLEEVTEISRESECAPTYHVEVAESGNMIVGGIITHNCIYGWRRANIDIILSLANDTEWQVIKLEQNYRSTNQIVKVANRIIGYNRQTQKTLYAQVDGDEPVLKVTEDDNGEARWMALTIGGVVEGNRYSDIAVLARTNKQLESIKPVFEQFAVPVEIINNKDDVLTKHYIRMIFSYLELAINPLDNIAFKRAVNFPEPRMTDLDMQHTIMMATNAETSLYDFVKRVGYEKVEDFVNIISDVDLLTLPVYQSFGKITVRLNLCEYYTAKGLSNRVDEIAEAAYKLDRWCVEQEAAGEDNTASAFFKWLRIRDIQERLADPKNTVKLMTVHAAKGLEFNSVFVAGMNQGLFPSKKGDLEEERRLFYVALTRAKRRLFVSRPAKTMDWNGRMKDTTPSQFIGEAMNCN